MNPGQGPDGQQPQQGYQGYPPQQYPPVQGYQGYPPPPPPGYPQPGYPQPGPGYPGAPNQGFNFQNLFQRWQAVITGRSISTFDAQLPSANWQSIWFGLLIYGVVRGIVAAIQTAVVPTYRIGNTVYSNGSPVGSFFGGILGSIIGFFIGVGILYLIARAFKGTATFLSYAYLLSLVMVPLGIVSSLVGWVPILGILAALALGIFEIYLAILATASAHRLPMNQAVWVVLIPIIVGVVLLFILVALLAALAVSFGGLPSLR